MFAYLSRNAYRAGRWVSYLCARSSWFYEVSWNFIHNVTCCQFRRMQKNTANIFSSQLSHARYHTPADVFNRMAHNKDIISCSPLPDIIFNTGWFYQYSVASGSGTEHSGEKYVCMDRRFYIHCLDYMGYIDIYVRYKTHNIWIQLSIEGIELSIYDALDIF